MRSSTVLTTGLLTCLISAVALATAAGQLAPTHKVPRNEPLEKYDNPPAPPRKMETSPRMISQFVVVHRYQVNVDASGHNIVGDAANGCAISVDPTNLSRMAIGWGQFDDVTYNFRQAGYGYTSDSGLT